MWCGFRRRPTEPKWYAEVITGGRAHYDAVALYYISNQGRRCIFPSSLDLPSILSLSVCPGVWFNRIAVWRRLCRGEGKREKTKRSKSQSQQQQQSELNINRELAGLTGWDPKTQRPLYAPSSLLSLSPLSSPYYCCSCSFIQRRDGRRKQRRPNSQRQVIQGDRRWKPLAHTPFLFLSLYPKKHLLHQSLRGDHPLSLFLVAMATPSKLSPRHRDPCCAKKDGILSKTHRISDSCSISIFNLVSSA